MVQYWRSAVDVHHNDHPPSDRLPGTVHEKDGQLEHEIKQLTLLITQKKEKMKKLSILAIAFAAVVFAACGGKKSDQAAENADSLKSFEQQQIEASIKMHFDSIAAEIGKL